MLFPYAYGIITLFFLMSALISGLPGGCTSLTLHSLNAFHNFVFRQVEGTSFAVKLFALLVLAWFLFVYSREKVMNRRCDASFKVLRFRLFDLQSARRLSLRM